MVFIGRRVDLCVLIDSGRSRLLFPDAVDDDFFGQRLDGAVFLCRSVCDHALPLSLHRVISALEYSPFDRRRRLLSAWSDSVALIGRLFTGLSFIAARRRARF